MSAWDFSRQNLTGCRFLGCSFVGATFEDAVLTGVYVNNFGVAADGGVTPDQIKLTWNYKHNRMKGIILPKDIAEAIERK